MTLDERIPGLSDADLKVLRANAVRLSADGGPAQKLEAARILPLIDAEFDERKARAPAPAKAAPKKAKVRKAKAN